MALEQCPQRDGPFEGTAGRLQPKKLDWAVRHVSSVLISIQFTSRGCPKFQTVLGLQQSSGERPCFFSQCEILRFWQDGGDRVHQGRPRAWARVDSQRRDQA